jgi:hypothetical protein
LSLRAVVLGPALGVVVAGLAGATPSLAQGAPGASSGPSAPPAPGPSVPAPGASAEEAKLQEAKELFRRGNAMRKAGALEGALELFLRSRALVPSVANTQNAAVMLDDLGRHDEALELYEALLVEFADRLSDEERRGIAAALGALQERVGGVFVSANVEGVVVIDGRRRGTLPLSRPVRLLAGEHRVLVLRDGYAPAEATATVIPGKTAVLDLRLEALTSAGRLAVNDETATPETEVLVDGAPVGLAPWAGQLAPGRHLVSLRGKELGTAPREVLVLAGQTVTLPLRSEPLGAEVRIETEPPSAQLSLDGVLLARGPFQGRLPRRPLALVAVEEGYLRAEQELPAEHRGPLVLRLRVDEGHPRWRKVAPLRLRVEAFGGGAFGTGLGSDAEAGCPARCPERSRPAGWLAGARGSLLLARGLRLQVGAGYLGLGARVVREVPGDEGISYRLEDRLSVAGPFALLGVGYGLRVTGALQLVASTSVGAFLARSRDDIRGQSVRGGEQVPLRIEGAGGAARGADFFALPELRAELSWGRFHAGLGLGVGVFFLDGPALPQGEVFPDPSALGVCATTPAALACAAGTRRFAGERAYRRHVLTLPTVAVGWTL